MDWQSMSPENCSVQRTLAVLGEKWTLLVLRDVFNGVHRFEEIRRHVGLSDAVLADRLRTLVDAGVLSTRPYREPGRRARQEYAVTERGWELQPVLLALLQWGDRHLADDGGPAVIPRHRNCGHRAEVVVRCTADGRELTAQDTELTAGPGAIPLPVRTA